MKPWAYYNDFDADTCDHLEELIRLGAIAPGEVDRRSILEVQPEDLKGFRQCHFFAGLGGWSYALRLSGWPDDKPVWTGSPPCQPFSSAGSRKGKDDERHLGPKFASLVWSCRPGMLFGEQVASADVFGKAPKKTRRGTAQEPEWAWLDDLLDRLEAARYAAGASDLPSASVGAPHIRQRTFFGAACLDGVADADRQQWDGNWNTGARRGRESANHSRSFWLGDTHDAGSLPGSQRGLYRSQEGSGSRHGEPERSGAVERLADPKSKRRADGPPFDGSSGSLSESTGEIIGTRHRGAVERLADSDDKQQVSAGNREGLGDACRYDEHGGLADTTGHGWREERALTRGVGEGNRSQGWPAGFDTSRPDQWLAHIYGIGCPENPGARLRYEEHHAESCGDSVRLDDSIGARPQGHSRDGNRGNEPGWFDQGKAGSASSAGAVDGLADADGRHSGPEGLQRSGEQRQQPQNGGSLQLDNGERPGPTNGFWRVADWLFCRDGKWRPIEARSQQMVDGLRSNLGRGSDHCSDEADREETARRLAEEEIGFPLGKVEYARVARLREYGNSINPYLAAKFIVSFSNALRGGPATLHCQSPLELLKSKRRDVEDLA